MRLIDRLTRWTNFFQFKTKMQIQIIRAKSGGEVQYRHVFHAGALIARQHGVRGVYQGLSATWIRNIPAFGCYFGKKALDLVCVMIYLKYCFITAS